MVRIRKNGRNVGRNRSVAVLPLALRAQALRHRTGWSVLPLVSATKSVGNAVVALSPLPSHARLVVLPTVLAPALPRPSPPPSPTHSALPEIARNPSTSPSTPMTQNPPGNQTDSRPGY